MKNERASAVHNLSTQKERWAQRAERYEQMAQSCIAKAESLEAHRHEHERDIAFLTQPGRLPARQRMHDRLRRAYELREKAERHAQKSANLRAMASRNKGDAERRREDHRNALDLAVGTLTDSIWGRRAVTKINTKTVRLEGVSCPVDKAHLRAVML